MRVDPASAGLATIVLAEVGGVLGAALAWLYLIGRVLAWSGTVPAGNALLGAMMWAVLMGGPIGAVGLPVLGLTLLRRVPLGRAICLTTAGAAVGLIAGALLAPHGSAGIAPPVVPLLAASGGLFGAWRARARTVSADAHAESCMVVANTSLDR